MDHFKLTDTTKIKKRCEEKKQLVRMSVCERVCVRADLSYRYKMIGKRTNGLIQGDKWKDIELPRDNIKKMKTRWIENDKILRTIIKKCSPKTRLSGVKGKKKEKTQERKRERERKHSFPYHEHQSYFLFSRSFTLFPPFSRSFSYQRSICIYFLQNI